MIHRLWLQAVGRLGLDVHHRDIVRAALEEFATEMSKDGGRAALERIRKQAQLDKTPDPPPPSI